MTGGKRLRILVLYWNPGGGTLRAAIASHLKALSAGSNLHDVVYHDAEQPFPAWLCKNSLDAIVLHNTFLCQRWSHLFWRRKWEWRWIADARCVKVALPQDEYDHSEVLDEWLCELGVSVIFSNFQPAHHPTLYPIMHRSASFRHGFTGYVDDESARAVADRLRPIADRPVDVAYRASNLPYWFGSHGQLKHRLAELIGGPARAAGLTCDVSTRAEDTILGGRWFDFLADSRTVLGCESGSSVLDRRGEIAWAIRRLLQENSKATFEEVSARLPAGWDGYRFFAVSPRHFEAVITKTCQVLIEGDYDGVLEPDRHYLPVRRDLSNLPEVLDAVKDAPRLQAMVDRAYDELYRSGAFSYRRLAAELEQAILDHQPSRSSPVRRAVSPALWRAGKLIRKVPEHERNTQPLVSRWAAKTGDLARRVSRSTRRGVERGVRRVGGRGADVALAMKEAGSVPSLRGWLWGRLRRDGLGASPRRLRQSLKEVLGLRMLRIVSHFEEAECRDRVIVGRLDEADGRLTLQTRPRSEPSAGRLAFDWPAFERLVRSGGVREVIWDHAEAGDEAPLLYWPVHLRRRVGEQGKASFGLLADFSREHPEPFLDVMRGVIAA